MSDSILRFQSISLLSLVQNAPTEMSFFEIISHSGFVGLATFVLLAVFSVVSWAIIFTKLLSFRKTYRESLAFLDLFFHAQELSSVWHASERQNSPLSTIFRAGYIELDKLKKQQEAHGDKQVLNDFGGLDNIERAMRRTYAVQMTRLESLLPFLATTGATAPFIGLFGTVWGIMRAFHEIGRMGSANLATVAPGISEALIATAAGLLAAIPAVMAYNFLNARLRLLSTEMENFQSDFLNILKRHFLV